MTENGLCRSGMRYRDVRTASRHRFEDDPCWNPASLHSVGVPPRLQRNGAPRVKGEIHNVRAASRARYQL